MWVCSQCGCQGIAAGLGLCPQCGEERQMPKATSGGASNAWEQDDAEPGVNADAAADQAQPAAMETEEPASPDAGTQDAAQTRAPSDEAASATGAPVTADQAPEVIDPNDTPPSVLPPGWTPATEPELRDAEPAEPGQESDVPGSASDGAPADAETSEAT